MKRYDLTGKRFHRLTVLCRVKRHDPKNAWWLCQCDCGNTKAVRGYCLTNGDTKSCGCWRKERLRTHGKRHEAAYETWARMQQRCTNPNSPDYHKYGARGITIDPAWNSFAQFYADMGNPPKGKSIDRIDNNGPYSKVNCRWATPCIQANNRRNTIYLTLGPITDTLANWARFTDQTYTCLYTRYRRGYSMKDIIIC